MENLVAGHTTPSLNLAVRTSTQLGGVILRRGDATPDRLASCDGVVLHRALRAGCLTGCRAEMPVSRAVYTSAFSRATHSSPVATLDAEGQR